MAFVSHKIICALMLFLYAGVVHAQTDSDAVQIELDVYNCNNNGICEFGENYPACPLDCDPPPPPTPTTTPSTDAGTRSSVRRIDPLITLLTELRNVLGRLFITLSEERMTTSIIQSVCVDGVCTVILPDGSLGAGVSSSGLDPSISITLSVRPHEKGVLFEWNRGALVRIVRNSEAFPVDPLGEHLLYEGDRGFFIDETKEVGVFYYAIYPKNSRGVYGTPHFVIVRHEEDTTTYTHDTFLWILFILTLCTCVFIFWRFLKKKEQTL